MSVKLAYIAGPFSAPTREGVEANIARAVALGIAVAREGVFPVVPHANTSHPDYEQVQPYAFWLEGTMALLRHCHIVVLVEGWRDSSGARAEVAEAHRLGIAVFDGIDAMRARERLWEDPFSHAAVEAALADGTVSAPEHEQP